MTADKIIFCLLLIIWSVAPADAQTRDKKQLQKEKQQNLDKIKETEKILTQTAQDKKNSLGELSALTQRIRQQEALILSVQSEIELMDLDIGENNEILKSLQTDLGRLKKEYGAMIFAAHKTSGGVSKLMFLFSARTFDQLAMRVKYMEQYSEARKEQATVIKRVQEQLAEQVLVVEGKKDDKNKLLEEELSEKNNLDGLKQKQNEVVRSLTKEEKRLKKDLDETKKNVAKLDKIISDIIREEIERAAREAKEAKEREAREAAARKKANNKTVAKEPVKVTTEPADALSSSFEENRNKFPWPAAGFISQKFGRQNHPVLRGIVIENNGVNIQTAQNEKVKSIFPGEVSAVAIFPGIGSTIILKHGEYFSVYTGLKDVVVKRGQKVIMGQEMGRVLTNSEGISEVRFQIRKNSTPLDPEGWLRN